jgi:tRNA/rRNA methyltransferase
MQGSREQEAGGKRQETEDRRQELEAIQNRSTEAHERPKSKIQNLVFPPSSPSPPSSLSFPPSPPSLPHSLTPSLPPPPAPLEQLEGFYQHLEAALLDIGYLYPHTAESRMQKFRRLYNRAMPTSDEVAMLRGILSQMDWAVKQRRLPK